jgi:broad specificity phosphatase PhoE
MRYRIYAMRHGEKEGDALTALGRRQVTASAKEHLAGLRFDLVLTSGRVRARETAKLVAKVVNFKGSPKTNLWFDYREIQDPNLPYFAWEDAEKAWKAAGVTEPVVFDVLKHWPPAWLLRGQITHGLKMVATELTGTKSLTAFVASHSGTIELAADVDAPGVLGPADIIIYTLDWIDDKWAPFHWEVLRCPPVD